MQQCSQLGVFIVSPLCTGRSLTYPLLPALKLQDTLSRAIFTSSKFPVFVETLHLRPPQCVGNDGMVFAVVERPFFAEVVAALEHFAVGVVTVVFVAGYQSVGLAVFDHDVVAVGETAQFFAVASVNGGQIAVAVIVVAHQFLAVEGDGGEAVDVETLVFGNEIVKEQMVQTTSKKIVRSSEKQKPRAYVPHVPYVKTEGFVQAMACCIKIEISYKLQLV